MKAQEVKCHIISAYSVMALDLFMIMTLKVNKLTPTHITTLLILWGPVGLYNFFTPPKRWICFVLHGGSFFAATEVT